MNNDGDTEALESEKQGIGCWLAGAVLMLLRLLAGRLLLTRALRERVDLLREHERLARLRDALDARRSYRGLARRNEDRAHATAFAPSSSSSFPSPT